MLLNQRYFFGQSNATDLKRDQIEIVPDLEQGVPPTAGTHEFKFKLVTSNRDADTSMPLREQVRRSCGLHTFLWIPRPKLRTRARWTRLGLQEVIFNVKCPSWRSPLENQWCPSCLVKWSNDMQHSSQWGYLVSPKGSQKFAVNLMDGMEWESCFHGMGMSNSVERHAKKMPWSGVIFEWYNLVSLLTVYHFTIHFSRYLKMKGACRTWACKSYQKTNKATINPCRWVTFQPLHIFCGGFSCLHCLTIDMAKLETCCDAVPKGWTGKKSGDASG